MGQKKSLGFLFQHFHCQVRGARRGYAQEEEYLPLYSLQTGFFPH